MCREICLRKSGCIPISSPSIYRMNPSLQAMETRSANVKDGGKESGEHCFDAALDTNPPAGAEFETSIVRRHCLLNLLHYDKSSLLAGKLHALLSRKYVKGRDVYDLMWYLSDRTWPSPNLIFLNNALTQSHWQGEIINADNWRQNIIEVLSEYDWGKVIADIRPFVEKQRDLEMLTKEALTKLLQTHD
jgi:hypothetical protein